MESKKLKMLTSLFSIILMVLVPSLSAQQEVKLYKTFEDYKADSCTINKYVKINYRTETDIRNFGGNNYSIYSSHRKFMRELKRDYWGVERNDSLFINCLPLGLGTWYAYAEKVGNNLFFVATKSNTQDAVMIGILFGAIGSAIASSQVSRHYYILDIETGIPSYLNRATMFELLSFDDTLQQQYKNEETPEKVVVLRKYLQEYKKRDL